MNGFTCNMKSSGKYERWEEGEYICIVDRNHERYVVLIDHFRKAFRKAFQKGIQLIVEYNIENEEGILIQGKRNCCPKLRKVKN